MTNDKTVTMSRELAEGLNNLLRWSFGNEPVCVELRALLAKSDLVAHCKQCAEVVKTWPELKRDCLGKISAPAAERQEPDSCDAANEENAPTFMGEPSISHPISWYQEGIAKHWKTICSQRSQIEILTESLKFYADRDHYSTDDGLNWDSCSGEPSNILWHEEQPWFIEDGSVARACLDKVKEMNQPQCKMCDCNQGRLPCTCKELNQ